MTKGNSQTCITGTIVGAIFVTAVAFYLFDGQDRAAMSTEPIKDRPVIIDTK